MGSSQQFSLRWNNYVRHITSAFESLRSDPEFVDVTLSCEGKKIKAHKMLLSACSSYFKDLFKENPCPHPVVVFRNVSFVDLEALIDFMYQGEVNVVQEQLASFLTTAELLAVQGLTDGTDRDITEILDEENMQTTPVPPAGTISERKRGSSSTSSSFTAPNPRPISPSAKRRKWSASSNNQNARNESGSNETSRVSETSLSASNSVQIPSTSQVKIEMPEFLDTDTDPVVYDNPESEGINPLEETGLEHGGSRKEESIDIYGGNSSDTGEHLTMSEADLNQVLAKAGPSSEGSQDSLQDVKLNKQIQHFTSSTKGGKLDARVISLDNGHYACSLCGKEFQSSSSCYGHLHIHSGGTVCTICSCVLSRKGNFKRHMLTVHGIVAP